MDLTNGVLGQNSKPTQAVKFARPSDDIKKSLELAPNAWLKKTTQFSFAKGNNLNRKEILRIAF